MTRLRTKCYQLEHCTYECSYHIVWTPRYRGKVLADTYIKQEMKRMIKSVYFTLAYIIQVLKAKTSTWIKKKTKKFPQGALWGRGYFVSTVGADEYAVKRYVQDQSHHQVELEQLKLPKLT